MFQIYVKFLGGFFMFIKRKITEQLLAFSKFFPIVALLGPRQSGKTTLAQAVFEHYYYLNLENIDQRTIALLDPRGFLEKLLFSVEFQK